MITVHHLEYSQSIRILWLMEELGVDYSLKVYERDKQTQLAPADYKAISPLGTSPVITDGELALSESNAIVDYILDKFDAENRLRPAADSPNRTRYLFWLHASQGSMMPLLLIDIVFRIVETRSPFFIRPIVKGLGSMVRSNMIKPRMDALLAKAEQDLAESTWLAGDSLTAADIVMSYCMEAAKMREYITDAHPNCLAWIDNMHACPSFKSAMEKDGRESAVLSM